jgi:hypothetical protein
MYLEVVEPWSDPPGRRHTSTVVDVNALNFLSAVGARLYTTVVDLREEA